MNIEVVKERDNPFFKRKDLVLNITHTDGPTPKTDDVKNELAKKYKVDISQIVVEYVMTKSGLNESTAKVKILNEKPPIVEEPKKAPEETPKKKPTEKPVEQKPEKKEEKPEPKKEPKVEPKQEAKTKPEPKEESGKDETQASKTE